MGPSFGCVGGRRKKGLWPLLTREEEEEEEEEEES